MPGSRALKNVMRGAKAPGAGSKGTNAVGDRDVHAPNKQYKQAGKKYSGPNYYQRATANKVQANNG